MNNSRSKELYKKALGIIPGGVNSPVRAFGSVGMEYPVFMKRGKGSKIYDVDGNIYIDLVMSWGAMILGHAYEPAVEAAVEAARNGSSFGFATEKEVELAELILRAFPCADMVRLTSSGTEAVMTAVRLARAHTNRSLIVKFDGCYHGHSDSLLSGGGSGMLTCNISDNNGITPSNSAETIVIPYNDVEALETLFADSGNKIAAVVVEPVAANMGLIIPHEGYLAKLREITSKSGAVLIFDEVITGFRLSSGGAQKVYGIEPDITTIGKIAGGGFPLAAVLGKREIMAKLAPNGNVYHAGTLSGNPAAVAAGIETVKALLGNENIYGELNAKREKLQTGIEKIIKDKNIEAVCTGTGSLMTMFFCKERPSNLEEAKKADTVKYGEFFRKMAECGVILPPSQFEAWFISAAHSIDDIEKIVEAAGAALIK